MKKVILLVFLIECVLTAFPQRLRLNGYARYTFDHGFGSFYNPNTFFDQWGAGLEYMMRQGHCFELQYLHQTTEVPFTYQLGVSTPAKSENTELTNCILAGSDSQLQSSSGKLEGYGGLFIGSAHLRSSNSSTAARWAPDKFSLSEKLGCNVWLLENVGLKWQAQFLSIVRRTGTDIYTGTNANNYGMDHLPV